MPVPHQPDDGRDDVDPTGIRELLASLPDPGPMPEDLVRRIQARLEVERAHQGANGNGGSPSSSAPAGSAVTRADNVLDLAAERSHRRPARTIGVLGAAAAGLLVTTVAVTQFMGASGDAGTADTAASYPSLSRDTSAGDASDAAGAGEADDAPADDDGAALDPVEEDGAEEGAAGADQDGAEEGAGADLDGQLGAAEDAATDAGDGQLSMIAPELGGPLWVLPPLGPVTADDLTQTFLTALDDTDLAHVDDDLTLQQARSCWQVLAGEHSFDTHVAARAQFVPSSGEARPAVALMGMHEDGTGEAWVLPNDCTGDARVDIISGPHPVD